MRETPGYPSGQIRMQAVAEEHLQTLFNYLNGKAAPANGQFSLSESSFKAEICTVFANEISGSLRVILTSPPDSHFLRVDVGWDRDGTAEDPDGQDYQQIVELPGLGGQWPHDDLQTGQ